MAWFGTYWLVSAWTVVPQPELVKKGRQVTEHFGLNTKGWKAYEVAHVTSSLSHSKEAQGRGVSPLTLRVTYVAGAGGKAAEVGFDSTGKLIYWRAPSGYKSPQTYDSDELAATAVFQYMAGAEAGSYKSPRRTMGDEAHEEDYEWVRQTRPGSELKEWIKVTTKDSVVSRVERRTYLVNDDEDSDSGDHAYWDVLGGIFGLVCTLGMIVIFCIYVLWLVRKAMNHVFPLRLALAALALMILATYAGSEWEKLRSVNLHHDSPVVGEFFMAAVLVGMVAVGRGISAGARPKWMSLEQFCRLAPVAKATGESLAAGVLFSPLLAAVPFLIVGCRLFPGSWVLPTNTELLYSRAPLLDSLNIPGDLYLLGFFGFGVAAFGRMVRFKWLRWILILPIGTAFFAEETRVVSGPLAAPLTAGFLTLAIFCLVWAYFDLLAVLTLKLASALLLAMLMLMQKGMGSGSAAAGLAGLLMAACWCYWRGQEVAEGDPRASIPALSGFRAEREKLRAEFSVARRAQQDMLPRTPPSVPGYTIAASCTPSLDVGGDLYDFLKLPDGRVGIGVADVSGKGVPAALYMTLTKGLLAAIAKDNSDLASVVGEVNRHLHGVTRKKVFVTMVLGFLDSEKRHLQCARAGHNPLVWRQAGRDETTLVSPGGIGLGITAGRVFGTQLKVEEMELAAGDAVVFYSDGITEAMNSELELFGEQRLMDAVRKTDSLDAAAARDSILSDVREFLGGVHPQDDMTLVVLRVGAGE
jgi:serine phosphatase RsbU (regulator of sigma subunit)